jgi:hypothetical protein
MCESFNLLGQVEAFLMEKMVTIICEECGNTREVRPYLLQKGWGKYCSKSCKNIAMHRSLGHNIGLTRSEQTKLNRAKRPDYYTKEYEKNVNLKKTHGISLDEFNAMLQAQQNKCAICSKEFTNGKDTHVDHDHITGKNRKLLCSNCNTAIGLLKHEPDLLLKAYHYLVAHMETMSP